MEAEVIIALKLDNGESFVTDIVHRVMSNVSDGATVLTVQVKDASALSFSILSLPEIHSNSFFEFHSC